MKTKLLWPLYTVLMFPVLALWHTIGWLNGLQQRERLRLLAELSQTRGLLQLLMKQRNGYRWTVEDRKTIRTDLKILWGISPYVILLLAPGGLIALPMLAWWLDRRKSQRTVAVRAR